MMVKVFAYYRVSTTKQEENETQKTQYNVVHEYLTKSGLTLVESFEDLAKSGMDNTRPDFNRMLERIDEVDGVVVYDQDRLTRNFKRGIDLIFQLAEKKKRLFIATTGEIKDFGNDTDQLVGIIKQWSIKQDYDIRKKRQIDGIARFIQEKKYWGAGKNAKQIRWEMYKKLREAKVSLRGIARYFGIGHSVMYKLLKKKVTDLSVYKKMSGEEIAQELGMDKDTVISWLDGMKKSQEKENLNSSRAHPVIR